MHPCLADWLNAKAEEQVESQPPRSFANNQQVFVCDLHPRETEK